MVGREAAIMYGTHLSDMTVTVRDLTDCFYHVVFFEHLKSKQNQISQQKWKQKCLIPSIKT